ncbi:MAG: integrase [Pelagibaca sp.]|nr:integrase [Pelagibaca sp.]
MNVTYEIKTTEVKNYNYRTPLIGVDADDKLILKHSKHTLSHIKSITLLNLVGRNESGKIVSYEPMEYVNRFLLAHHIENDKEESAQKSKALVKYFDFLIQLQERWDEEYDEDTFDEMIDPPRPTWDSFPVYKSQKVTYQFREALKNAVLNRNDLARTTATAYMREVVNFYKFHIRHGHSFNNPPFEHEVITINYQAGGTSMKAYQSKEIHTTDLRLNFPKSKRNDGGSLPSAKRDLRPLTKSEWNAVEDILSGSKTVLKVVKSGELKLAKLPLEYCLLFLVCRYAGLRKEEAASLHLGQIVKPLSDRKISMRFGVGGKYGSMTKTVNGGNKSRQTIIPKRIMELLYDYSRSERYRKRIAKFKALCKAKRASGEVGYFEGVDGIDEDKDYLFISATGKPFFTKLSEANTRWNEVRATVEKTIGLKIEGTIHNLRSTFAVVMFRVLLKLGVSRDEALAEVSKCLGHEDEKTTLDYLIIAEQDPTGDEIYEDVLEYVGVFDDLEIAFGEKEAK